MTDTRSTLSRTAWTAVLLLLPVALLNYLDRQMLAAMKFSVMQDIPSIGSEANWGFLPAVFKWVYAFLSPVGGYLADRLSKKHVIVVSLFVWSAVTWTTGHCTTFDQLLVTRALMGISEACYIPAALALIADFHVGSTRSRAVGLHQMAIYIGVMLGGFSGHVADDPNLGWRWAFDVCGLVGVLYAVPLFFFLQNAPRRADAALSPALSAGGALRELLGNRYFLFLVLCFTLPAIPAWVVKDWMPAILKEKFDIGQNPLHQPCLPGCSGARRLAGRQVDGPHRPRPHLRQRHRPDPAHPRPLRRRQCRLARHGRHLPRPVWHRLGLLRLQQHAHPLPDRPARAARHRLRPDEPRQHQLRRLCRLGLRRSFRSWPPPPRPPVSAISSRRTWRAVPSPAP